MEQSRAVAACHDQARRAGRDVPKKEDAVKERPGLYTEPTREEDQRSESVVSGQYPEWEKIELPDHLKSRHKKTPHELLEESLLLP